MFKKLIDVELSINTKYFSYKGGSGETIDFSEFGTLANNYLKLKNGIITPSKIVKKIERFKNKLIKLLRTTTKRPHYAELTQPARDVPGTSPEGPLKVLTSRTSRGFSGDSQGTKTKIDDLMKKLVFRFNRPSFTHLLLLFTGKTNIQKI